MKLAVAPNVDVASTVNVSNTVFPIVVALLLTFKVEAFVSVTSLLNVDAAFTVSISIDVFPKVTSLLNVDVAFTVSISPASPIAIVPLFTVKTEIFSNFIWYGYSEFKN